MNGASSLTGPRKEIRVKLEEAALSLILLASCICPMHGVLVTPQTIKLSSWRCGKVLNKQES